MSLNSSGSHRSRFGSDVRTDHRQIQKRGYVASRSILPIQHDVMQIGVWSIFRFLHNIDLHANWRVRIKALANASVQETTLCKGKDVRLVLGQRRGIGLSGQLETSKTHLLQPDFGAVWIYFQWRQYRLILTELHRLDI